MIIAKTKEVEEFCKKNKIKFHKQIRLYAANRQNARSRKRKNLLVKVNKKKDFMKQKNSGIDEVFCKLAKEKEKKVYLDLNSLFKADITSGLQKVMQNLMLLQKYKVEYDLIYFCNSMNDVISDKEVSAFKRILESK